jgi:outer membrane protein assembly factor BamA
MSAPSRAGGPSLSTTVLDFNATQFVSGSLRATGYVPLGGSVGLALRGGLGHLLPFGRSVPETPEQALGAVLRLREEVLTAGGLDDVRGWADRMLGPKFPEMILQDVDGTLALESDGYTPLGGFNRAYSSVELRFPLPWVSWRVHSFLDGGRVWTSDERFTSSEDPYGLERYFWATGFGIDYATPLGSIRLTLGYKLNPSILDLADSLDVLTALLEDRPLDGLDRRGIRRFRLHIGLGGLL